MEGIASLQRFDPDTAVVRMGVPDRRTSRGISGNVVCFTSTGEHEVLFLASDRTSKAGSGVVASDVNFKVYTCVVRSKYGTVGLPKNNPTHYPLTT
jgi:hypothetical protein